MSALLKKALYLLAGDDIKVPSLKMPKDIRPFKKLTERELIQLESQIGRELFGPIPAGHRREFFNLDEATWIWYEEFHDEAGLKHTITTRYEIKDSQVLKAQDGKEYEFIEGDELHNLTLAIQAYYERVMREVYKRDPATGQKFTG